MYVLLYSILYYAAANVKYACQKRRLFAVFVFGVELPLFRVCCLVFQLCNLLFKFGDAVGFIQLLRIDFAEVFDEKNDCECVEDK